MMRMILLAGLLLFAPGWIASAQAAECRTAALPDGTPAMFCKDRNGNWQQQPGKVVTTAASQQGDTVTAKGQATYRGTFSASVGQRQRVRIPSRFDLGNLLNQAINSNANSNKYEGAVNLVMTFDGAAVTAQVNGTGGLSSGTLTGLVRNGVCRLIGSQSGYIWEGPCSQTRFSGTIKSAANNSRLVSGTFDTVASDYVDSVERDRQQAVAKAEADRPASVARPLRASTPNSQSLPPLPKYPPGQSLASSAGLGAYRGERENRDIWEYFANCPTPTRVEVIIYKEQENGKYTASGKYWDWNSNRGDNGKIRDSWYAAGFINNSQDQIYFTPTENLADTPRTRLEKHPIVFDLKNGRWSGYVVDPNCEGVLGIRSAATNVQIKAAENRFTASRSNPQREKTAELRKYKALINAALVKDSKFWSPEYPYVPNSVHDISIVGRDDSKLGQILVEGTFASGFSGRGQVTAHFSGNLIKCIDLDFSVCVVPGVRNPNDLSGKTLLESITEDRERCRRENANVPVIC